MIDFNSESPPEGISEPLWPADVARIFNVDPKTVTRWANEGRLPCIRTAGGMRRYWWDDVRQLGLRNAAARPAPVTAAGDGTSPAAIRIGQSMPLDLRSVPAVLRATTPGHASLILGCTRNGAPVTLTARSLEWLDELESAIRAARAAGIVEAGMQPAVQS